jgi:hypothetical protein
MCAAKGTGRFSSARVTNDRGAGALVLASVLLASLAPGLARAEEAGAGRYTMSPTQDGYLKLDTRTGDVTECRRSDQGYRCMLSPDERTALQAEIDRLAGENAGLRQALQDKGVAPPPAVGRTPGGTVPSDQEFDRALSLMERFMRRFMAIVREDTVKDPTGRPAQP